VARRYIPLYRFVRRLLRHSAVRFAIVGIINTGLDLIVFVILRYRLGTPVIHAHVAGFLLAVFNSFFMNKYWTFGDYTRGGRAWRQAAIFALSASGALIVSSTVLGLAAGSARAALGPAGQVPVFGQWTVAGLTDLLAKFMATGASFLWNYFVSRAVIFRRRQGQRPVAQLPTPTPQTPTPPNSPPPAREDR